MPENDAFDLDTPTKSNAFDLDTNAPADPFGPGSHAATDDSEFDEYEAPPTPVGVLPGFVKTCKKVETEKNGTRKVSYVLEIECTDPEYANAENLSLWIEVPKFIGRLVQVAAALGLTVSQSGTRIRVPKPEAFVNRPGMFVYSTYADNSGMDKPTIAWGYPSKKNQSDLFDAWAAEANLTDEQIKSIKQSPGVIAHGSF